MALGEDGAVTLQPETGETLRYEGLLAWDSTGQQLPGRIEVEGGTIHLVVDDSGAVGMVTVDPLMTTVATMFEGNQTSAKLGISVASAGDVNGDGLDDLIVGARYADPAGAFTAGRSYVVFGKSTTGAVEASAIVAGIGGFVINGQCEKDHSGVSVAGVGDVNGDGLADLLVGADGADPAAGAYAGRSFVVFGRTGGAAVARRGDPGFGYAVASRETGDERELREGSAPRRSQQHRDEERAARAVLPAALRAPASRRLVLGDGDGPVPAEW